VRRDFVRLALFGAAALALPRAARASEARVTIDNFAFTPAMLTVPAGTEVSWTNRDDIPHTVTSALRPPLFKSPALDTGDRFSTRFDRPGIYGYFCSLHPHMEGTVVVT
jgi:plastocyanin